MLLWLCTYLGHSRIALGAEIVNFDLDQFSFGRPAVKVRVYQQISGKEVRILTNLLGIWLLCSILVHIRANHINHS